MAGFFFCLASANGAGLLFLPENVSITHKRLQRLFCCPCNYTLPTPKPFTGLYSGVSVNLTHSNAHNTADTQAAYAPLAPRRTLYRPAQPPYYNKVYKGAAVRPMLWIHARRYSIAQTVPARRLESWRGLVWH